MIYFTSVYEDELTHQIMMKLYNLFKEYFTEIKAIPCRGNGKIKRQIKAYNKASQFGYYFVITDLDDNECAPSLIKDWMPEQQNSQLLFRVAVREIESWLLADRANFASFFSISQQLIPLNPDNEKNPKQTVIALAKRSKKREIREAIVPIDDYVKTGPRYNIKLQYFIQNNWCIDSARKISRSLDKAIIALEKIANSSKLK